MRKQSLLEKRLPYEVREIADRQVDLALLEPKRDLIGRHRYRPDSRVRRLRAQLFQDPRQKHHLTYVRKCECERARGDAGIELLFREYGRLHLYDEGPHDGDERMRAGSRR